MSSIKMAMKLLTIVGICLISLGLAAGESFAAGPAWSGGFPKLVQNDVLLQWQPVKGATEYKVYKSEQKGKGLKLLTAVKANRYIDKGIGLGKTLYYYVAPVIGGKEGERSAEGAISTAKEKVFVALKTPSLIGAHVKDLPGGKYSIGVRWESTGGTDFVGVNVYRSTRKGRDYTMIGSSSSDTYEDNDVKAGDTYYYVVTAVDSQFKETKNSNEVSVNIPSSTGAASASAKTAGKETVPPTTMRPAKLLYRIPREGDRMSQGELLPKNAQSVAIDEAVGHIYVTSLVYGGVLVYNMDGELQFGIRKDGVGGTQMFRGAKGVVVGPNGNLYVTGLTPEIFVYDFTGRPLQTINMDPSQMASNSPGHSLMAYDLAFAPDGTLIVTDPGMNGIHAYSADKFRNLYNVAAPLMVNEKEKAQGKLYYNAPSRLVVTDKNEIIFVDAGYSRLVVYGLDGKFKRFMGNPGSGAGELFYPEGIALGNKGELFVASGMGPNVQAFTQDGKFLYALSNEKVDGPLNVDNMRGIHIDKQNRLYIAEGTTNRVSVFQLGDKTVDVIPK